MADRPGPNAGESAGAFKKDPCRDATSVYNFPAEVLLTLWGLRPRRVGPQESAGGSKEASAMLKETKPDH